MVPRLRPELVTDALLVAVAMVWGGSFLAAKDLSAAVGVPAALALRFLVATVTLGPLVLIRRERLPRGRDLVIAIGLGLSQAAVIGLETAGVHQTSATNAGVLISLALVLTPLFDGLAARDWLPRSYFAAAGAAVAGVALLVSDGGLRTPGIGDLLVLAAALVRALHVTASARLVHHDTSGTLGLVLVQLVTCCAVFAIGAGPALAPAVAALPLRAWLAALFLGVLCSVFAFVVQLWAVRRTSASRASILMGTEPVWALVAGVVLAGESIGIMGFAGAVLIVSASYAGQALERGHRRSSGTAGAAGPQGAAS